MLASNGYRTKKALKESVGQQLRYTETSYFTVEYQANGNNTLVGPSAYERKWYATVTVKDGLIVSVK